MQCYMMYSPKCLVKQGEWESNLNFYKSNKSIFLKYGYIPYCKHCLQEFIGDYVLNEDKVIQVTRMLDVPFIRSIYTEQKDFHEYLKTINRKYKDMTFDNSAFEDDQLNEFSEEDLMGMKLKFGEGYTAPEYLYLASEMNNILTAYEAKDYIQEGLFQEIAILKLKIQRENKKPEGDTKKLQDQLYKAIDMANLKPATSKTDGKSISEKIRLAETKRPIISEDTRLKDVDNLGYLRKYFIKHFRKVMEVDKDDQSERSLQESDTQDQGE